MLRLIKFLKLTFANNYHGVYETLWEANYRTFDMCVHDPCQLFCDAVRCMFCNTTRSKTITERGTAAIPITCRARTAAGEFSMPSKQLCVVWHMRCTILEYTETLYNNFNKNTCAVSEAFSVTRNKARWPSRCASSVFREHSACWDWAIVRSGRLVTLTFRPTDLKIVPQVSLKLKNTYTELKLSILEL